MNNSPSSHLGSILRLLGGILIIVLISLGIFYFIMRPPMSDLGYMAQFLTITALISGLAGYAAYRFRWLERAPALRWSLARWLCASQPADLSQCMDYRPLDVRQPA